MTFEIDACRLCRSAVGAALADAGSSRGRSGSRMREFVGGPLIGVLLFEFG